MGWRIPHPSDSRHFRWIRARFVLGLVSANIGGLALIVSLLLSIPRPIDSPLGAADWLTVVSLIFFQLVVCVGLGVHPKFISAQWYRGDVTPTPAECLAAVRLPVRVAAVQGVVWVMISLVFVPLNFHLSVDVILAGMLTVALGGALCTCVSFLFTEHTARPLITAALEKHSPLSVSSGGITARLLITWTLTVAIPIGGVFILLGLQSFDRIIPIRADLRLTILLLSATALGIGFIGLALVARTISEPLGRLSSAVNLVGQGDHSARVEIYDATEIGHLQRAFNVMAAGLDERERMRELFGRQVGHAVAEQSLRGGMRFDGVEVQVAVLFVDIIGSTSIATRKTPAEVVSLLNSFFAVVVDAVQLDGGMINKFEGDAALAVYGAPTPLTNPAGSALTSAVRLASELRQFGDLRAAVGVSFGTVVAGHIGSASRFEYTVIGDPVNEAARLTEVAKTLDGLVAASGAVVRGSSKEVAAQWRCVDSQLLRGRSAHTDIWIPSKL
jgi:adenylate cyclase